MAITPNEETLQDDGTALLLLSTGQRVIVDQADLPLLRQYHWCANNRAKNRTTYVQSTRRVDGIQKNFTIHRLLMGFPVGLTVDHINHDGLDNRRANLRLATYSQNLGNKRHANKHGYKGVHLKPETWSARVTDGTVRRTLGNFKTKEEAARAYDAWAYAKWGEFACLNFPEEINTLQV